MKPKLLRDPFHHPPHASDMERLQGAWISVFGNRYTQLLIAGNHYAVRFRDVDEIYMGTFELDENVEPRRMDMLIEEGRPEDIGKISMCIYEVDEETLHWCPNLPGKNVRLEAFPTDEDINHSFYTVFKRDWP